MAVGTTSLIDTYLPGDSLPLTRASAYTSTKPPPPRVFVELE